MEKLEDRFLLSFSPIQVRHAYGFDRVAFLDSAHAQVAGDGQGQTIAIVDPYDDPNISSDLATFDSHFGLAAPPSFQKVNQTGGTTYPSPDLSSAAEIALDVEYAHAMAPGASILLVEANDTNLTNADIAVQYAANHGATAVSMSYGVGGEFAGETSHDTVYTHAGVTYVSSTGDNGAPGQYQAYSPNVMAVGGTTLTLDLSGNYSSESGWSGSGGGISQFEAQPSYQNGVVTQSTTHRTIPDVSFVADPNTGVTIYDSYGGFGYVTAGGTSASAPIMAGLVAVVDQGRSYLNGLSSYNGQDFLNAFYHLPDNAVHDILSGSNSWVSSVQITNGGSGYTQPPVVTFSGGGGSGATGVATIAGGVVSGVTITHPGAGYTSAPAITFSGGGGAGAAGTAVLTGYAAGPGYDLVTGRGTPIVQRFVAGMTGDPVLDPTTGNLLIVGGGRLSSDTLTVNTSGAQLTVAFNLSAPVPGNGRGGSYTLSYPISSVHSIEVVTHGEGSNPVSSVNINGTPAVLTTVRTAGNDSVTLGTGGSVQGILGPVTVDPLAYSATLNVVDSADGAAHGAVTLSDPGTGFGQITGLAPGPISYRSAGTSSVAVWTGAGSNTVNVLDVIAPLTLVGNSNSTAVNVGRNRSLASIQNTLTVHNPSYYTDLRLDDSADTANRTVTLTSTGVTGLSAGAISFFLDDLKSLTILGGSGSNTYTVYSTPGDLFFTGTTLNTGNGVDTVNVQAASTPLTINGGTNNPMVNFGNAGTLAGITAAVTLNNNSMSTVNINDGADNANHPAVVIGSGVTGLAPAPINSDFQHAGTVNITVGNGADTYSITQTPHNALNLTTGAGTNTVTVTSTGNRVPITLTGNTAGVNTLVDTDSPPVWHITGANAGNVAANTPVSFTGYGSLTGGSSLNATFVFSDGASLSGTLDGGAGGNATLDSSAYSTAEAFTLSGRDAGTGTPVAAFVHIWSLVGAGVGGNYFQFGDGASLDGNLNGGSGGSNTLDLSASTANLRLTFVGLDAGSANVMHSFSSIQNMIGGSGSNTFYFNNGTSLDGTLDGGSSGSNTLTTAYSTAVSFTLSGRDAGTGTPVAAFVDIQNLSCVGVGGSYFQFADGARLDGNLAGGGGATLDYSPYTSSIVVDLQPAVAGATGVGGSISGVTTVIGASGAPGTPGLYNLLIGSAGGGDILQGGTGRRNLLVAGGGPSTLIGGDGEDLLIGGTTIYDTDPALTNWLAIADYWAGTDDFPTRSANLQSGTGVPLLDATAVTGNGGGNTFQGNGGTALIYTDALDTVFGFGATAMFPIAP